MPSWVQQLREGIEGANLKAASISGEPHPTVALCLVLLRLLCSEKQIQNTQEKNSSEPRMKKKSFLESLESFYDSKKYDARIPGGLELQKRDPSVRICGSRFLSGFYCAFKVSGSGIGGVKVGRSNSSATQAIYSFKMISTEKKSEKIK